MKNSQFKKGAPARLLKSIFNNIWLLIKTMSRYSSNWKVRLLIRVVSWLAFVCAWIFSSIPIDWFDQYISISPVIGIVKIIAEGARNIMQIIGLTLLTHFTDLPSSIGKLIANVPKGTVIPNIECISYDNFLRTKNVKDAVTGNGSQYAPVFSDGRGNITWLTSPKAKLQEYFNPVFDFKSYKDYLWYLLYSIAILFLGFCFLAYMGSGSGPDSGPNFDPSADRGEGSSKLPPVGILPESGKGLGIIASFWRGSAKIRSWFKSNVHGTESRREDIANKIKLHGTENDPILNTSYTNTDFSRYFKNLFAEMGTDPKYADDKFRIEAIAEMDRVMKYVPEARLNTNPETGLQECYLLINGQEKLFWSNNSKDERSFFLNPSTGEMFDEAVVSAYDDILNNSIGPRSIINGDRPDSPSATDNQLGANRHPKMSFNDDEGNSIAHITNNPVYADDVNTSSEWSEQSPRPRGNNSVLPVDNSDYSGVSNLFD